jgi:hypothetical protein
MRRAHESAALEEEGATSALFISEAIFDNSFSTGSVEIHLRMTPPTNGAHLAPTERIDRMIALKRIFKMSIACKMSIPINDRITIKYNLHRITVTKAQWD